MKANQTFASALIPWSRHRECRRYRCVCGPRRERRGGRFLWLEAGLAAGEVSLFRSTDRPAILADSDAKAVELGVRFRTDVAELA